MGMQGLGERKTVTMAAGILPYTHPYTGTVHIKSPLPTPTLCFDPMKPFATIMDFLTALQTKNG